MAKQKNKPSYSIYPLNALNFKKLMIRSGMKSARKNLIPELAGKIFKMMKKSCLDQHLCVTETMWHSEGKNVLFVPDANFLSNLLKANYAMDGDFSLNLPHSSFILAMPDFKVDNVIIPSVIVHFCTAENRIHRYNKASQLMNVKAFDHEENDLSGLDNLSFFYADPYGDKGIYVQVNLSMGLISASLQAETADEYAEIIGQIPKDMVSNVAVDTTEKDSKIQYAITKILVGLSIYLSANENARLIEGLPNNGRISISNFKRDTPYSFSYLDTAQEKPSEETDVIGTRRWFFRNLKHEKYYKNKYEKLKPGSRWVFVPETKIGVFHAEHVEEKKNTAPEAKAI